jgi:DNA-binding NtrC family response regulator
MSNTESNTKEPEVILESKAMKEVSRQVALFGPTKMRVLLTGERGVGKEITARDIHQKSCRNNKPFKAVNCGGLPDTLLHSQLFGHEKGAFTDAISQYRGMFEQADGGTLFLDEIGLMPPEMQARLLRVVNTIDKQEITRLGGEGAIKVDVRIISATNIDLEPLMQNGKFGRDLYDRLVNCTIHIPPLRKSPDDIETLILQLLPKVPEKFHIINKDNTSIAPEAVNNLKKRHWGGNVRELESALAVALINSTTNEIQLKDLPPDQPAVGLLEDTEMVPFRNPTKETKEGLKRKFEDTQNKLKELKDKLKDGDELPKDEEELSSVKTSDIEYLAAVILKSESGQSWKRFGEICDVSADTCQRKQTQWRKAGTIESADRLLKEHPPLDG